MPGQHQPTSRELAARFEQEALPCRDLLYRCALGLTRSPADAEDLVQETLTKAWAAFGGFRAGTNIRARLHRIMTNTYIHRYRKPRREPLLLTPGSLHDPARFRPQPA